jgi:hypothetical protein
MADASWAQSYADLGSLKKDSDLAIIGMVTGVSGQTVRAGVPFTDFNVRVIRTLQEPRTPLASSTIIVHQTGGRVGPNRYVMVHDDPLFRIGETMALFLSQYAPGHFAVLGGPQGRFEVSRGTVTPSDHLTPRLPANRSVDEFAKDVARA